MSYEPKDKMKELLATMQETPDRIWSTSEVAQALGVTVNAVNAYTSYAVANGALYRGERSKGDGVRYAVKPFGTVKRERFKVKAATTWEPKGDIRVPQVVEGWKPPQMIPPRAT